MAPRAASTVCSTSASVCAAEITKDWPSTPRRRISCRNRVRMAWLGVPDRVGGPEDLAGRPAEHRQRIGDAGLRGHRVDPGRPASRPAAPWSRPDRSRRRPDHRTERGQRDRLGAVGAGQQEDPRPVGVQAAELHQLAPPGDGRDREPVAHRLAPGGQVRRDPVHGLRPAGGPAEPGDRLVEDQHDAVPVAERAHALQEARGRLGQRAAPPPGSRRPPGPRAAPARRAATPGRCSGRTASATAPPRAPRC